MREVRGSLKEWHDAILLSVGVKKDGQSYQAEYSSRSHFNTNDSETEEVVVPYNIQKCDHK